MVTHDRFFLERVCNEIIELDNGKLYQYKGNYSYYREERTTHRVGKRKYRQSAEPNKIFGCASKTRTTKIRNRDRMIFT
jgi:ATP-binding cassette subfamily F protein uup